MIRRDPRLVDQIPQEVFISFYVPHLDVKDIGALSILNKALRELGYDEDVWKILYTRTTPLVILDTSVHLGSYYDRKYINPDGHEISYGGGLRRTSGFTPVIIDPCEKISQNYRGRWASPSDRPYCTCGSYSMIQDQPFPSMVTLFGDKMFNMDRKSEEWRAYEERYKEIIREKWMDYNAARGLSTVNLCQRIDHYDINTLGFRGRKNKPSSFRKITLKKLKTKKKNETKKQAGKMRRAEYNLHNAMKRAAFLKKQYEKEKGKYDSGIRLEENLENAIQ